jgi:hypothetical protein
MIYRNVNGNINEIKKTDFPNDQLYYTKIYENILNIAKSKEKIELEKAFYNKNKKQTNKQHKNVAASDVHI